MTPSFEKEYWEEHWHEHRAQDHDSASTTGGESAPNPHLVREIGGLTAGSALDAGCGTGADAIWLAGRGWRVTGADISSTALALATARRAPAAGSGRVTWVEADLTTWVPAERYDLVVTSYAHPSIPQLAFYDRLSEWVAPGGTLLIVGHLQTPGRAGLDGSESDSHGHGHPHGRTEAPGHHPPAAATVTLADITGRLDPAVWRVDTAEEDSGTVTGPGGHPLPRHDAVVRATRLR